MRRCSGSPVVMPTSQTAAVQGGRLLSASICVFSMKIVSVRIQLCVRMVRSSRSALPTKLKSGSVFVTSGVFVQISQLRFEHLHPGLLGDDIARRRYCPRTATCAPSPQKPYIMVSMYSTCGLPFSSAASSAFNSPKRSLIGRVIVARHRDVPFGSASRAGCPSIHP